MKHFSHFLVVKSLARASATSVAAALLTACGPGLALHSAMMGYGPPTTGGHVGDPVEPGQLFPGDALNVHAPESPGWILGPANRGSILFGRMGDAPSETYVARAALFQVPAGTDAEQFTRLVEGRVAGDEHPNDGTMKIIETRHEATNERGYLCVKYQLLFEDANARTSSSTYGPLTTEAFSEYCQNATKSGSSFYMNYSHRGPTVHSIDPEVAAQAESFFRGIQIPSS